MTSRCRDCGHGTISRSLWEYKGHLYCTTDFQIRYGFSPIGSGITEYRRIAH